MSSAASEGKARPMQYLTFFSAGEEYAVDVLGVRELIRCSPLTRVPTLPAWVRGLANVRGTVLPVMDLALRCGLPETPLTHWTCIVVLELRAARGGPGRLLGVLAEQVGRVIDLAPEAVHPPPAFGGSASVDLLQGVGSAGDGFLLLLDVTRLAPDLEAPPAAEPARAAEGYAS